MDDNEIRSMLIDIVESGNFPTDSFEIRHIEKIDILKVVSENKVRFEVKRHPHLFGKPTLGGHSSAYIPKYYLYELDIKLKEVVLIKKEQDEPEINYWQLAMEDVSNYFDYGDVTHYDKKFKVLNSKDEVIGFAKKEVENLNWKEVCDEPTFQQKKYMAEIRKQFIDEMIMHWNLYQREFGE